MKRPSFQFYPGDWQGNAKLRRCSHAERGVWLEVMCLMHDSEEYGIVRWPLKDIAQAVGCKASELRSLQLKGVLKGIESGQSEPFVYVPRHGGKEGQPVTLIASQAGPIWYSSRMVRDEYVRIKRGIGTRFGDEPMDTPKDAPKVPIGDGPSSSSSSSEKPISTATAVEVPDGTCPACPHELIVSLYHEVLPSNPKVLEWTDARRGYLRSRWKQKAKPNGVTQGYATTEDGLTWWRKFFGYVSESPFLTGQANGRGGQPPFVADLEWLIRPTNFTKVIEGKYHR